MTDSEKLDLMLSQLVTIKSDMQGIKSELKRLDTKIDHGLAKINLILENDIKPSIRLIVENYEPSATRFETAAGKVNQHDEDIQLLNLVVSQHSEALNKLNFQ